MKVPLSHWLSLHFTHIVVHMVLPTEITSVNSVNQLIFVTETGFFVVGTVFLNNILINFVLQRVNAIIMIIITTLFSTDNE